MWKKFEELAEYRGPYVRLSARVHVFTQILFILLGASLFGDLDSLQRCRS